MVKRTVLKKPKDAKVSPGTRAAKRAKAEEPADDEEEGAEEEDDKAPATNDGEEEKDDKAEEPADGEDDEEENAEEEGEDDEDDAPAARAKKRISLIVRSSAANGLPALANHLAFDTNVSSKAAIGILKAAAKDKAAGATANKNPLAAAMSGEKNPDVRSGPVKNGGAERMLSKVAARFPQRA